MQRRTYGFLGPVIAVVLPLIVYVYLKTDSSVDTLLAVPKGHFYFVSIVSILSALIAVVVGIAGSRLRNSKVSFLSLAFLSLAQIFAVHGLSTPGFLLHPTHVPGVTAQLSVILAVIWLWLSSLSSDRPIVVLLSNYRKRLVPIWLTALTIFSLTSLMFPHMYDVIPIDRDPLKWPFMILTIVLSITVMYRYYQSYQYSRFPLQICIVYSAGWLIAAQIIMATGELWRLSWWLYHFLLLMSMVIMLVGLLMQYSANKSFVLAIKALFTTDPVERITNCISPSVKALILATESKDTYTAGHNLRVSMYALKLAEELKLVPEQLRALAQGSIVHDVGKMTIPDFILNKPGRLTEDERAIIEQHPAKGYEMCKSLGFMKDELDVIRSHHERWDGTGYPDRLRGEEIPLLPRVVAVADVYDALTSHRAYRKAWTHEEAMRYLMEQKGSQFDPKCVEAWVRVCEEDPEVHEYAVRYQAVTS